MGDMTRRDFARFCGGLFAAALAARPLTVAAAERSSAALTLKPEQWRMVEAICSQIIPSLDGYGAREANCVNFIDKGLAHEEKQHLPSYERGLRVIEAFAQTRWRRAFVALDDAEQIRTLEMLEDGDLPDWDGDEQRAWFAVLHYHTLLGFAAAPKYGGNANFSGWRAMQFPGNEHELGGVSDAQVEGTDPIVIRFPHHG